MVGGALLYFSYIGIEEDFLAWKRMFIRDVFPALCGEMSLLSVCRKGEESSCKCESKAEQNSCSCKVSQTTNTLSQDVEVSLLLRLVITHHYFTPDVYTIQSVVMLTPYQNVVRPLQLAL